jgi:hypothetical protein
MCARASAGFGRGTPSVSRPGYRPGRAARDTAGGFGRERLNGPCRSGTRPGVGAAKAPVGFGWRGSERCRQTGTRPGVGAVRHSSASVGGRGAVSANGHPSGRRRCEALFGFGRRARSGAGKRAPVRESRSRISLRFRLEGVRRRRQTGTSADAPPAIGHRPGVDVTASTSASVGGGGVHQQMDTWSLTRGCADLSSASVGGGESPSARGHPSGRRCGASFCRFGGGG